MNTHTLVVFPDGQTWNTADGCGLIVVNEETFRDIIEGRVEAGDAPVMAALTLADFTPGPRDGNAK